MNRTYSVVNAQHKTAVTSGIFGVILNDLAVEDNQTEISVVADATGIGCLPTSRPATHKKTSKHGLQINIYCRRSVGGPK